MIDFNDTHPTPSAGRIDLDVVLTRLRDDAGGWVPRLFPNGRREGDEWRLANIRGDAPRKQGSCVITLTGERAGEWFDFDGGDGGGILNTIEKATGLAGRELIEYATGLAGNGPAPTAAAAAASPAPRRQGRDDAREIELILSRLQPAAGTLVDAWFASRGLPAVDCPDLLFHPDLTCWDTRSGWPAMVAVVRDHAGNRIALHRTYLAADGSAKAPVPKPRKMLGPVAGGAVRLAAPADGLLGLGEGIETTRAVMHAMPALPAWATLSAVGLEQVVLPADVRRVVILADHDPAGLRAAEVTAARLHAEGRRVWIAMPPREGDDFNDLLVREDIEAVRAAVEAALEWAPPASLLPAAGHGADLPAPVPELHRHPRLPVCFAPPANPLPPLRADNGDLASASNRCWDILEGANTPPWLFRIGGQPGWIERDDQGLPQPIPLSENRLRHVLALVADWRKLNSQNQLVPAHPPIAVVKNLLATANPDIPVLAGVVTVPVFGRDGTLVTTPGYHPATRLLFEPGAGFVLPAVPMQPTAAEVAAARTLLLDDMLGDFPFTSEAERAHALALLLLPLVREMIDGPTPLHMIEKPTPGTGASLMVEVIAEIALGATPSFMAEGRDDDEWRKRLTAKLRSIPAMVMIDNLNLKLDSGALSAALTMPSWEDRVLGVSEMTRFPIRCVWVATGNNPQFSHEMARRIVRIRLDAHVDQPWRRKAADFRHADLRGWAKDNRSRLLSACLTLGQAWVAAGRPRQGERSLGSFDNWAAVMGGILQVAGVPGFLTNLDETYETADSDGATWRAFVACWWDRHGTAQVGTADLYEAAVACEPPLPLGGGSDRSQRTRLGKILGRMRDRIFALGTLKLQVRAGRVSHQAQHWQITVMQGPPDHGERGERFSPPEIVGERGERCPLPELMGERGERFSGSAVAVGEHGERCTLPEFSEAGERGEHRDQRSPQRSPEIYEQNQCSGERGEPGERFSRPRVHTHAHTCTGAHMCEGDAEKRSPGSPCSPIPVNSSTSAGERGGERGEEVPPGVRRWWEEVL